ncbi:MAG: hypothetical protein KatS3mg097_236 [Candidatus Parcubacteria bacterium]|nr:MAG: hypothetical protein KatS3mg097_236 [Candidatus Parcubacteria bacterium]
MNDFRNKILFIYCLTFLLLIFLIFIDIFFLKTIKIVKAVGGPENFPLVCSIDNLKGRIELFTIASNTNRAVAIFKQSNNKKFLIITKESLESSESSCDSWSDYNQLDGPKISKNNTSYGFIGKKGNLVTIFFFSTSSDEVINTSSITVRSFDLTDDGSDFIAVLVKRNRSKDLYVYNKNQRLGPFKKVSRPILEKNGDSYAFYADGKLYINREEVNLSSISGSIQTIDRIIFDPYSRGYVVSGIKNDGKSFLLKSSSSLSLGSLLTFDNLSRVDNIYFAPNNNFAFTYLSSTPSKREMYIYVNGYTKGPYDKIEKFVFSESYTTSTFGFIATKKTDDGRTRYFININNKEVPVNGFVYDLRFSQDGEKYAFIFNVDNKTLISFGRVSDFVNASSSNIHISAVSAGTLTVIPIDILQESDIPNVYGPFDILFNYNFNPDYLIYVINNRYYVAFLNEQRVFGYYNLVINYSNYLIGFKDDDQYLITPYNEYGPYKAISNVLTPNVTSSGPYLYSSIDDDFKTYVNIIATSSMANPEISFGPYDLVSFLELRGDYFGFIGSNLSEKKSTVGIGKIDGEIQENEFYKVSEKIFFSPEGSAYAFLAKATSGSPVAMYINNSSSSASSHIITFDNNIKTIDNIEILKVAKLSSSNKINVNLFNKRNKQLIKHEIQFGPLGRLIATTPKGENANILSLAYNQGNVYFISKEDNGYNIYRTRNE